MDKAKRKAIIAGNWKMNKTASEAAVLVDELVPAVQASNIGGCASVEIVVDKETATKGGGTIGDLLMQMVGESLDGIHRNCYETRAEAKASEPKQAEIITIEYDPDDWGSQ